MPRMAVPERPVLVAPDSFKGTLRATEVAGAIGRGLERAGLMPPDLCPVADGGDGTLEALVVQLGGETAGAVEAGAQVVMVGVGGSATTDGGAGALEAISERGGLGGAKVIVLCGVRTPWERAPEVFGPQKGADAAMVKRLERRRD